MKRDVPLIPAVSTRPSITRHICIAFGLLCLVGEAVSMFSMENPGISFFSALRILAAVTATALGAFASSMRVDRLAASTCAFFLFLVPLLRGIEVGGICPTTLAFTAAFPIFYTLLLGPKYTLVGTLAGAILILFLAIAPFEYIYGTLFGLAFQPALENLDRAHALNGLIPIFVCGAATYTLARQNRDMEERLNRDAVIDNLTGIPNRRAFDRQVIDEIERAQRVQTPLSMLVFDIDNFKMYNDLYGHQAGDQALQHVARAIDGVCVRNTDFVARYGGEEFVALLPATTHDRAELLATKIQENLRRSKSGPIADHQITISAGIAVLSEEARIGPDELFRRADEALYESKRSGKDCVTLYRNTRAARVRSIK